MLVGAAINPGPWAQLAELGWWVPLLVAAVLIILRSSLDR